jgi:hypothetical protein
MLSKVYKPGEPGAALIIVKDGRVLARKGFGTAMTFSKTTKPLPAIRR